MKRGDIVFAAERSRVGGKPRPWLIVQSDAFNETHASITVCMISASEPETGLFRLAIDPSEQNGLTGRSTILIDVLLSIARRSVDRRIGTADAGTMAAVDAALRMEDDGAGHHRTGQAAAANFVNTCDRYKAVAVQAVFDIASCRNLRH